MDLASVVYVSSALTFAMTTYYMFQDILSGAHEVVLVKEETR